MIGKKDEVFHELRKEHGNLVKQLTDKEQIIKELEEELVSMER